METDAAGIILNRAQSHPRSYPGCVLEDDWQFARALEDCTCEPGNRTMDKMDQESIDRTLWRYRAPGGLTLPMARDGGYPTPY